MQLSMGNIWQYRDELIDLFNPITQGLSKNVVTKYPKRPGDRRTSSAFFNHQHVVKPLSISKYSFQPAQDMKRPRLLVHSFCLTNQSSCRATAPLLSAGLVAVSSVSARARAWSQPPNGKMDGFMGVTRPGKLT